MCLAKKKKIMLHACEKRSLKTNMLRVRNFQCDDWFSFISPQILFYIYREMGKLDSKICTAFSLFVHFVFVAAQFENPAPHT
jgi:hypothetical protein